MTHPRRSELLEVRSVLAAVGKSSMGLADTLIQVSDMLALHATGLRVETEK